MRYFHGHPLFRICAGFPGFQSLAISRKGQRDSAGLPLAEVLTGSHIFPAKLLRIRSGNIWLYWIVDIVPISIKSSTRGAYSTVRVKIIRISGLMERSHGSSADSAA